MNAEPTTGRAAARLAAELREAIDQAKLGYEFAPNSYSYGALSACLAAEQALSVLRAALESELGPGAGT